MKNSYKEKHLPIVQRILKKQKCSIKQAVILMSEELDIEYSETMRKSINSLLLRRGYQKSIKAKKEKKQKQAIEKLEESRQFQDAVKKPLIEKETYIISWAQNATPVHKNLLRGMELYAKKVDAAIHIIAGRYKNPTSIWTDKQECQEHWSSDLDLYLDANRQRLCKYLQVLGDVKISPTASTPLSGLKSISGLESCIVGHPRQHLQSLPVLEGYPHKLLLSTGSCTIANYTDSKAGKKGEFHHMLGFVIVEKDYDEEGDEFFHIRQVNADDDGNFYDVLIQYQDGILGPNAHGCDVAVLGDVHTRHNNKKITKKVFKLLDFLKPKHTIVHDIAEMESILHWDERDPFRLLQKENDGTDNLEAEVEEILDWIKDHLKYNLVMARSNHDDMLDRWLKSSDWRKVPNKSTYLKYANILANNEVAQNKGVLPYLIEERFKDRVTTLSLDDSFRVHGWELAMHGHLGANGSRGGHVQFKNLNTKNATGHGHHPHREDGHVMVGTLSHLRVGFNRGPSNWMNGLGLLYKDKKFQLIHVINNKCCRDF